MTRKMTVQAPRATRFGAGATGAVAFMAPGLLPALILAGVTLLTLAAFHVGNALSQEPVTLYGEAARDEDPRDPA